MLQKTDNMEFDQNSVRNIADADWWTWPPLAALSRVRGWPTFQFVRFQSRSCSCFSHWRSIVATDHSHERGAHADPGGRAVGSRLHVHQLGAGGRGRHTEGKNSISDGCSSSPSKPCTLFLFPYFSQINRHRCPLHAWRNRLSKNMHANCSMRTGDHDSKIYVGNGAPWLSYNEEAWKAQRARSEFTHTNINQVQNFRHEIVNQIIIKKQNVCCREDSHNNEI